MEPVSVELCESLFFKARTVTLPFASSSSGYSKRIHYEMNPESDESCSSSSDSSSCGYSTRIRDLMKLKSEAGMSKEDAEIEASKSHWTETAYYTAPVSGSTQSCEELLKAKKRLDKENLEVMRSLQREDVSGCFFEIGGTVLGRKIAEGGQATIYDGGLRRFVYLDGEESEMVPIVLKVFKAGYSLSDLQKQWPLDLQKQWPLALSLKHKLESVKYQFDNSVNSMYCVNLLSCGRLLEDGRFAFEMVRLWGDLRKLLDARLIENGKQRPPLMISDGHYLECCMLDMWYKIAMGMKGLHMEGTLHRDLKASNVLMESSNIGLDDPYLKEGRLDPLELRHAFFCLVADYECSVGVVGTRFWRAPEVLEAVKNGKVNNIPNLFTPKVDVYSYAMTCYEILTGLVPFEHVEDYGTTIEAVIEGKRPTLPKHLKPWVEEMLHKCWHGDPSERPSFEEILITLTGILNICREYHSGSSNFLAHTYY